MSNLSDLLPAGASGKTIEAVATAIISSKAPVSINAAGTISPIVETTVAAGAVGSLQTVSAYNTEHLGVSADPFNSNRWIVAWMDDVGTKYAYVRVITRSGTTLTMSSQNEFYGGGNTSGISVAWDTVTENNFLCIYNNSSNQGSAVVGTVSGSAGSESFNYGSALNAWGGSLGLYGQSLNALGTSGNWLVTWGNPSDTKPYGRILQLSGTTVSAGGSNTVLNSSVMYSYNTCKSTVEANSTTAALACVIVSDNLFGIPLTISGTTITVGSSTELGAGIGFNGDAWTGANVCMAPANATTYLLTIMKSNEDLVVMAIRLSGGTMSNSTPVTVTSSGGSNGIRQGISNNLTSPNSFVIQYNDAKPNVVVGTLDDTTITLGTPFVTASTVTTTSTYAGIAQQSDTDGHCIGVFRSSAISGSALYGYAQCSSSGSVTSNSADFIGIADAAISSAATGTVVVQGGTVTGMSSLTTGGKYYVQNDGTLTSPNATAAYSINGATYDSVSFDVTQDSTITGMCFNGDGTKMYVCGEGTDTVYQYSLSSAYDLSTASYDSVSLSVASQQGNPRSVVFNNDGSALYICGPSSSSAHQYTLSTPYDLSTGSYASKTINLSSQELYPCGLIFNNDGSSMYVVGSQNDTVYQYTLSTPFDLSTASYASKSMSVNSEQTSPTGLAFNSDGTKIFVIGETTPKINQYTLSSAYDISTGSYDSVSYTYSEGTVPRDIVWGNSGNKFYIPDSGPDDIYQYTAGGGASSSVNAGLAISTTSLLLNGDS